MVLPPMAPGRDWSMGLLGRKGGCQSLVPGVVCLSAPAVRAMAEAFSFGYRLAAMAALLSSHLAEGHEEQSLARRLSVLVPIHFP